MPSYLGTVKAELWSDNGSGRPNAKLADLTVPSTVATAAVAFARTGEHDPLGKHKLFCGPVFTANFATTNDIQVEVTARPPRIPRAATGWSIANIGLSTDPRQ